MLQRLASIGVRSSLRQADGSPSEPKVVQRRHCRRQIRHRIASRCYSSAEPTAEAAAAAPHSKKVPLKAALKKFYLLVHPDLFAGHKDMQHVNDNSFKSLMEYLESYKSDTDEDNSSANKQYHLKFYVKTAGADGTDSFRAVSSTLTLPLKGSGTEARQTHLLANITPLLRDCGYTHEVDVTGYGERKSRGAAGSAPELPLLKMLLALTTQLNAPKTSAAAKKYAQIRAERQKELDAALAQLKALHKGSFATEFAHHAFASPVDRINALTKAVASLHQALSSLPPHVSTSVRQKPIIFAHKKKGLHPKGHIYIDITESHDAHVEVLHSAAEPTVLTTIQEREKKRATLENAIRSALDLASLSSDHNAAYSESYINMLEEICRDIPQRDRHWRLPEHVRGKLHVRFIAGVVSGNPVDASTSSLTIPVDTTVEHVREFLQTNAKETVQNFSQLDRAVKSVATALGVRSLSYQPGLDVDNLMKSLERLGTAADLCRPFMNGLNICIADIYGVNEDSKTVFVKWDFLL